MAQTLNDCADGFKAIIEGISGSDVVFYPEADEKASGTIAGEVFFREFEPVGPFMNSRWDIVAVVELSTAANKPGWSAAIRRIRDYTSPFGDKSIIRAINENPTLGGRVNTARPQNRGVVDETRKRFADGERWTQEVRFVVRLSND